jgi:ATP-dependent DNA helicase PIF1
LPGETRIYRSADRAELEGEEENNVYSQEFLHGLNASGLPLHNLELKEGAPVMLLGNLSPAEGLCNGTRLVVLGLTQAADNSNMPDAPKAID